MRAWNAGLVVLLLLGPAFAGCLGDGGDPASTSGANGAEAIDWVFEDFIVDEHDHAAPDEHRVDAPTVDRVAYHPLGEQGPYTYIGELDSRAGLTAVAVLGQGSTPGFVLLDTSDPSQPEVLGRAEAPQAYATDVKLTSDGQYAMLATQQVTTGRVGTAPTPDTLTDGRYAARNGIMVWDISEPAAPEMVLFAPAEAYGCHMLSIAQIDGTEWVFCKSQALTVYRFERAPEPALVQGGVFWPSGTGGYQMIAEEQRTLPGPIPHDMTYQPDPLDGTPTLSISHWDLGAVVLDVSNPLAPEQLFQWNGEGASEYHGFVHTTMLTTLDDRRLMVTAPETLDDVIPAVWVVDVTDFSDPELVAEWTNPGQHTSQGLLMTTHQFQIVDGTIYLAYNHNGLWTLDLATMLEHGGTAPDHTEIRSVYLPHDDVELTDRDTFPMGTPAIWDVNVVDGYVLATDRYTGLHVTHVAGDPTGDEAYDSFA